VLLAVAVVCSAYAVSSHRSFDGDGANRAFHASHFLATTAAESRAVTAHPGIADVNIHWIFDPAHLVKRWRNSLAHSFSPNSTRYMVLPSALIHSAILTACVRACASSSLSFLREFPHLPPSVGQLPAFGRVRFDLIVTAHKLLSSGSTTLHCAGALASERTIYACFDSWAVMSVPLALAIFAPDTRIALFEIITRHITSTMLTAADRLNQAFDLAATLMYCAAGAELAALSGVYDRSNLIFCGEQLHGSPLATLPQSVPAASAAAASSAQPPSSASSASPSATTPLSSSTSSSSPSHPVLSSFPCSPSPASSSPPSFVARCEALVRWLCQWRDTAAQTMWAALPVPVLQEVLQRQQKLHDRHSAELAKKLQKANVSAR
jgi:hypothetical protein